MEDGVIPYDPNVPLDYDKIPIYDPDELLDYDQAFAKYAKISGNYTSDDDMKPATLDPNYSIEIMNFGDNSCLVYYLPEYRLVQYIKHKQYWYRETWKDSRYTEEEYEIIFETIINGEVIKHECTYSLEPQHVILELILKAQNMTIWDVISIFNQNSAKNARKT